MIINAKIHGDVFRPVPLPYNVNVLKIRLRRNRGKLIIGRITRKCGKKWINQQ
ncbi:MAG: hypothetical protein JW863_09480 [Chitinispirillaceae bacterium]|nr:hypothetical protein [Chitinispirillaceae bacterium]